jgi:hypothetical protein
MCLGVALNKIASGRPQRPVDGSLNMTINLRPQYMKENLVDECHILINFLGWLVMGSHCVL